MIFNDSFSYTMFDLTPLENRILLTKFTIADAGCSGSKSANKWHWLSGFVTFGFRATNPNMRLKRKHIKPLKKIETFPITYFVLFGTFDSSVSIVHRFSSGSNPT